jgi:hypothetical protein
MLTEPTPLSVKPSPLISASIPLPSRSQNQPPANTTKPQVNWESMAYRRRNFGLDLALARR